MKKYLLILFFVATIAVIVYLVSSYIHKSVLGTSASNTVQVSLVVKQKLYPIKITLLDENKKPIVNAKVTLYSTPVTEYTDKTGTVVFEDVVFGTHRIVIEYKGKISEQTIDMGDQALSIVLNANLTDKEGFFVNMQTDKLFGQFDPFLRSTIALTIPIILIFLLLVIKKHKKLRPRFTKKKR
jgi:hypothetical protein